MIDILAATQAVVAELRAAGVRAAIDGRDLNPPAVQVRPPTVHYRVGREVADAEWEAWAVVPDTGVGPSLVALSKLVEDARAALGGRIVQARPDSVLLADAGVAAPAYVLTWSAKIT